MKIVPEHHANDREGAPETVPNETWWGPYRNKLITNGCQKITTHFPNYGLILYNHIYQKHKKTIKFSLEDDFPWFLFFWWDTYSLPFTPVQLARDRSNPSGQTNVQKSHDGVSIGFCELRSVSLGLFLEKKLPRVHTIQISIVLTGHRRAQWPKERLDRCCGQTTSASKAARALSSLDFRKAEDLKRHYDHKHRHSHTSQVSTRQG